MRAAAFVLMIAVAVLLPQLIRFVGVRILWRRPSHESPLSVTEPDNDTCEALLGYRSDKDKSERRPLWAKIVGVYDPELYSDMTRAH